MSCYRNLLIVGIGVLCGVRLLALNTDTHRLINRRASQTGVYFEEYLRDALGFSGGLTTVLQGTSILEWLEEGGVREDDRLRFLRHFHDPLKPWAGAGLNLGIDRYDSSVRWMQEPNQGDLDTGGFSSWRDARRLYYQALVESNARYRQVLWADLFRALGQIMHLVVDASVPSIRAMIPTHLAASYPRARMSTGFPDSIRRPN